MAWKLTWIVVPFAFLFLGYIISDVMWPVTKEEQKKAPVKKSKFTRDALDQMADEERARAHNGTSLKETLARDAQRDRIESIDSPDPIVSLGTAMVSDFEVPQDFNMAEIRH